VKRFRFKSKHSPELQNSKSLFLQLNAADLPGEVKLGYLFLRVKLYIPRPLRCYKCNRYGHVVSHCRGKLRCSICGGEHKHSECRAAAAKCPNCGGSNSANEKICPRYKRETEILKLKTEAKLSYADASQAHRTGRNPPVPNIASQSAFPPLPKSTVDRSHARPFISTTPLPHATGGPLDQDELIVTEQTDFSSFLFCNPVNLRQEGEKGIKQTILAKNKREY